MVSEWSSDSEVSMMSQPIDDQLRLLQQKTGDSKWYGFPEYLADQSDWTLLTSATYNYRRRKLKRADNQIRRLQKQFPGAGFQTFEQLLASAQEETRKIREDADRAGAAPGAASTFGMIGGMITGSIRDPIMAASMVFGASPIVGGTIRANAARAFKTEALIGGLSEAAIQPFVSNWKEEINNPISVKEMAMHIAFAAVGAGALRAAGSAVVDRFQISKIKKVLGEKRTLAADGDKEAGVEADILEEYLRIYQPLKGQGRQEEKAHLAKIEEAQDRMEMGIPPRADPESGDAPGRTLYEVDPREVEVDAKTFQFKEGGDVEGVTDALTGVTRWDPELANTVMIWERADGKRFIADGHQRLALAKRAIADGQNPNEVKLQAMIYREAEGFTPEMVRGKAAYRNISMGTGSVLDAAKMIRESKGRGMEGLPILPPRGRLTQAAEGLARLDDEAFQMVVNGIGDPRHAAIVGRLIDDPQAQRAAISELAKAEPGNLNQAELIVHDMNRAGFVHTETVDLFGGQEMAETLFKERAQVIDAVMKGLRKDRGLFRTLEARSSTITEAGNVLDRAGNIQRLSEDERTLQVLTALANSKGPVSEAINQAARKVKEGATPGSTAGSLLESVKRASDGAGAGRIDDAKVGDVFEVRDLDRLPEDIRRPFITPPSDRPELSIRITEQFNKDGSRFKVARTVINRDQVDPTAEHFSYPDLEPTLKDSDPLLRDTQTKYMAESGVAGEYTPARTSDVHQDIIDKEIAKGARVQKGNRPMAILMGGGGASGKGTVLKQLQADGVIPEKGFVHIDPDEVKKALPEYKKIHAALDYRAAAVVHEESSDIAKAMQKKAMSGGLNMIIDKTMGVPGKGLRLIDDLKAAGYEVRLVGVTIDPSEALTRALERYYSSGRLPESGAMMNAHKGFNGAFEVYARKADSALLYDNTGRHPTELAKAIDGKISIVSDKAYNDVGRRSKLNEKATTHQKLKESQGLEAQRLESPSVVPRDSGTTAPAMGSGGIRGSPGRPGIDAEQRLSSTLKESGLDLGDPSLDALHADELRDVQRLLDQEGDTLELPTGLVLEDGETVVNTQTLRSVFDDLDAQERAVDDLFTCTLQ
jgi:predicted ABC-type ATPase